MTVHLHSLSVLIFIIHRQCEAGKPYGGVRWSIAINGCDGSREKSGQFGSCGRCGWTGGTPLSKRCRCLVGPVGSTEALDRRIGTPARLEEIMDTPGLVLG